jgi:hypothetical protein
MMKDTVDQKRALKVLIWLYDLLTKCYIITTALLVSRIFFLLVFGFNGIFILETVE